MTNLLLPPPEAFSPAEEHLHILLRLQANYLFAGLDADAVAHLVRQVELVDTPAGQAVVREGEPADALFVVLSGGVNVTKANGQYLAFLGPGGFFGEMALWMPDARRSAHCIAQAPTRCVRLSKLCLEDFCRAHPATGLIIYSTIIRTLAERLQATSSDLAMLMGGQVQSQQSVADVVARTQQAAKSPSPKAL